MEAVCWLDSGSRVDSLVVEGTNILELDIEAEEKPALSSNLTEPFVDPAILSYDRPEDTNLSTPTRIPKFEYRPSPPTDSSSKAFRSTGTYPGVTHPIASKPAITLETKAKAAGDQQDNVFHETVASATLAGPFNDLSIQDPVDDEPEEYTDTTSRALAEDHTVTTSTALPGEEAFALAEHVLPIQPTPKPSRRRFRKGTQRGKPTINYGEVLGETQQHSIRPDPVRGRKDAESAHKWHQARLSVAPSHLHHGPNQHTSKPDVPRTDRKSRRHLKANEEQNGWATGEASDIQDMGDFDFEGNLSKFDKRKVFEKIRQEDTTADEERLVSFNRVHSRPGTNGGKNFHYSENVLDSPNPNDHLAWNKGDSEDEITQSNLTKRQRRGGNSYRQNLSARNGSAIKNGDRQLSGSGPVSGHIVKARHSSNDQAQTPKVLPNQSVSPFSSLNDPLKPSLRILPSNRICPCLSPLQMVELEQLATSELGLTEDMITENAARGIAETSRELVDVELDVSGLEDQLAPLIFIMAGNHRSGARAIAAGRHLRNHHTRVVVCVLGLGREEHLIDSVRRQLFMYRNCGGLTSKPAELVHSLEHLQAPRTLIVDALLGIHASFGDLREDDQTAYYHLSKWANSSEFSVISIDVPSGLDASSGKSLPKRSQNRALIIELKVYLQQKPNWSFTLTSFYLWGLPKSAF